MNCMRSHCVHHRSTYRHALDTEKQCMKQNFCNNLALGEPHDQLTTLIKKVNDSWAQTLQGKSSPISHSNATTWSTHLTATLQFEVRAKPPTYVPMGFQEDIFFHFALIFEFFVVVFDASSPETEGKEGGPLLQWKLEQQKQRWFPVQNPFRTC